MSIRTIQKTAGNASARRKKLWILLGCHHNKYHTSQMMTGVTAAIIRVVKEVEVEEYIHTFFVSKESPLAFISQYPRVFLLQILVGCGIWHERMSGEFVFLIPDNFLFKCAKYYRSRLSCRNIVLSNDFTHLTVLWAECERRVMLAT